MAGPERQRSVPARRLLPLGAGLCGLALGWAAALLLGDHPTAGSAHEDGPARAADAGHAVAPSASTPSRASSPRADLLEQLADASSADLAGMLTQATTRLDPTQRLDELSVIYRRYAELEPEAALEHAFTEGASLESAWSIRWIHDIFSTWARNDVEAAVQAAAGLATMKHRAALAILAAIPPADRQSRASVTAALHLDWDTTRTSLEQMLAIADDPEAAFRSSEKSAALAGTRPAAARAWAASEPRAAAEAVAAIFEPVPDGIALGGVMAAWSEVDVDAAAAWVQALSKPDRTPDVIAAAVGGIASVAPRRAVAIAESLGAPEQRSAAVASAFGRWAAADPRAAADGLAAISNPKLRDSAVRPLGLAYARLDPRAAYRWAAALPPDEGAMVIPNILIEMARSGFPEQASGLVADIEIRTARNNAAVRVAEEWARQSPRDALEWSRSFGDEAQQPAMVEGVFARWALADGRSALRGTKQLEGVHRQAATEGLLRSTDTTILEGVYTTAEDPALRAKAARRLAIFLGSTDRERALHYRAEAQRLDGT